MLRSFFVLCVCCVGISMARRFNPFVLHQDKYLECGPNEVATGCINPCPPQKTCQDREDYKCFAEYVHCEYQCHCKEGFIRKTEGGECIPEVECGPYCGPDQVHTDCKKSCLNETCAAIKNPSNCVNEVSGTCEPGCVYSDGYFRVEEAWPCVPRCDCPEMQDAQDCLDLEDDYE